MRRVTSVLLIVAGCALAFSGISAITPPGSGGPDGGGYYWFDQGEDPDFFNDNWVDISGTGTPYSFGDDAYGLIGTISWGFQFYGVVYNDIYASDNGVVMLTNEYVDWGNSPIPSDTGYCNTFMAPWWTDMYGPDGGAVYFQDFGDHFVVMYHDIWDYDTDYTVNYILIGWEAEGSDNSDIAFLYDYAVSDSYCTVGIQGDPTTGTQSEYNPAAVSNGDWYLYTVDPGYFSSVEEISWGAIKAEF